MKCTQIINWQSRITVLLLLLIVQTSCSIVTLTEKPAPTKTQTLESTATITPTHTRIATATLERTIIEPRNIHRLMELRQYSFDGAYDFIWLKDSGGMVVVTPDRFILYNYEHYDGLVQSGTIETGNSEIKNLTTSSNSDQLAWSDEENRIVVWSLSARQELMRYQSQYGAVTSLALDPNGNRLAVSTIDNHMIILDVNRNEGINQWLQPHWLSGLMISPNGELVAGLEKGYFTLKIFDIETGVSTGYLDLVNHSSPTLYGAIISPDWKYVAWYARGTVQLAIMDSGENGPVFEHEDYINGLSWSPDNRLIATAAAGTHEGSFQPLLYIWDVISEQLLRVLSFNTAVVKVMFSFDGKSLAILDYHGILYLWEIGL